MIIGRKISWLLPTVLYAAIAVYFLFERASLFIMLFGLWCELVIMLLFYMGLSLRDQSDMQAAKGLGVLGGAGPILLIQFCIASGLSHLLKEFTPDEGGNWPELLQPLHAFQAPVIVTCASLMFIYGTLTRTLIREQLPLSVVESGLLFQASLLAILGFASIVMAVALWAVNVQGQLELVLIILAGIRIILQPRIKRAFEAPTNES